VSSMNYDLAFLTRSEDQGVLYPRARIPEAFGCGGYGSAAREKFAERRYVWRPKLVKRYDEAKTYIDGKWLTATSSSERNRHDVTEGQYRGKLVSEAGGARRPRRR